MSHNDHIAAFHKRPQKTTVFNQQHSLQEYPCSQPPTFVQLSCLHSRSYSPTAAWVKRIREKCTKVGPRDYHATTTQETI